MRKNTRRFFVILFSSVKKHIGGPEKRGKKILKIFLLNIDEKKNLKFYFFHSFILKMLLGLDIEILFWEERKTLKKNGDLKKSFENLIWVQKRLLFQIFPKFQLEIFFFYFIIFKAFIIFIFGIFRYRLSFEWIYYKENFIKKHHIKYQRFY